MNSSAQNLFTTTNPPIGLSLDSEEFRTSSYRLAQFAHALDDENPHHLSGEFAPPVFSHVPVMQSMVEVLNKVTDGFVLHGEHDFHFHAPIVPGQRLFSNSTLTSVRGTRAGVTFVIRSETSTHIGKPVCTQYSTCLVRGEPSDAIHGEAPPVHPVIEKVHGEKWRHSLALDQTRRYADAARDYSAYTIDPAAAAKGGFPAPIVHGLLTLSLAARAVVDRHCGGQTPKLSRLGCRFTHPLYLTVGQSIEVEHWNGADGLVGFEAVDRDGNIIIKNGYAQVSS